MSAIAGVDEVGVGALQAQSSPSAVILAARTAIDGLADSRLLTVKRRGHLFAMISGCCALAIGIGRTEVEEIDRH